MTTCGVDTVSVGWRPRTEDAFDELRRVGFRYGPAGGLICQERGPADERILAWPAHGLLTVEGRMGAILAKDRHNHDLVPAAGLDKIERATEAVLRSVLGFRPDQHTICEMRRYDLAGELAFDDPGDGLAMLRTLGAMCPSRARMTLERSADGQVMTAYVRTPKRGEVQQRFYDKGLEAGTHPPGHRIRLESQLRPPKHKRMAPTTLGRLDLRSHFIRRMESFMHTSDGVVAAGDRAAATELLGRVARGELSMAKAERLIGSVTVLGLHGRAVYDQRQGQRRLKALRDEGVALENHLPPDRVVPVGALLRDLVEGFNA